jgi:hypothetical protein
MEFKFVQIKSQRGDDNKNVKWGWGYLKISRTQYQKS